MFKWGSKSVTGQGAAASHRRLAGALASAAFVAAVAGCGDSPAAGPLVPDVGQKLSASCVPAPNLGSAVIAWNTPVWFALDMFVNESRSPLTIESVTLIDPHNVVLRGALVYEMAHSQHPLIQAAALADMARSVPAADWERHRAVPGAVIPAGHHHQSFTPSPSLNIYEIVPEVAQKAPGGGWALGETVKYRAGGRTYTVKAYTGYAIGLSSTTGNNCDAPLAAINAAFEKSS